MDPKQFEKLGTFYLGREYDLEQRAMGQAPLLYDAKDLTTHAFCVGMTGSGKTGLCVSLLEEAAIDGVPALIIDPKGDLGNLMLTFPKLSAAQFRPWIDADEAARKELSPDAFAKAQADLWRNGLADWGQGPARIKRLREAASVDIFTPGSEAGRPLSILSSFAAPPPAVLSDGDLLRDRVGSTVTGLLGLLGMNADPIRSREHILISTVLDQAWRSGVDLDLAGLIRGIQQPGFDRVGVMELDAFFPAVDRFGLAMQLNNLLAAPGFQSWLSGEPLDIQSLLYQPDGRPRLSIFSIAHLPESQRMFFVALLLNEVLSWVRTRPGTNSLRALVYMDEIAGYLPPVGEPPSKKPMLTLLKQARAFGVGVVLATQNPVDLDYKGLSNTGTWFLGRLQTERDKERVMDGLEGVGATAAGFDRKAMERTLSGLGKRVFMMHNVHEPAPVVFHTRWAMSYLRGPLTRNQIKQLMGPRKRKAPAPRTDGGAATAGAAAAANAVSDSVAAGASSSSTTASKSAEAAPSRGAAQPLLKPTVPQAFLPLRARPDEAVYRPRLLGLARVQFVDRKSKQVVKIDDLALSLPLGPDAAAVDWAAADRVEAYREDLEQRPEAGVGFEPLHDDAEDSRRYRSWSKQLSDWLYRQHACELLSSPALGVQSTPDEDEAAFRVRLADLAREQRDAAVEKLRKKYGARVERLQERMRRAEQKVEKEEDQASNQKLQTAISFGASLLSAVLGRKAISRSSVGRMTTAVRGATRAGKERQDVKRAKQDVDALRQQIADVEAELAGEIRALEQRLDPRSEVLESVALRPRRSDVDVKQVCLVWEPIGANDVPLWR